MKGNDPNKEARVGDEMIDALEKEIEQILVSLASKAVLGMVLFRQKMGVGHVILHVPERFKEAAVTINFVV